MNVRAWGVSPTSNELSGHLNLCRRRLQFAADNVAPDRMLRLNFVVFAVVNEGRKLALAQ